MNDTYLVPNPIAIAGHCGSWPSGDHDPGLRPAHAHGWLFQINSGPTLAAQVEEQRTAEKAIPAPRGLIYDRKGRPLVTNVATFAVKITPSELPFSRRDEVAQRLAASLAWSRPRS